MNQFIREFWSLKVDKKKVWRLLFEEVDGLKIIFDEQTLCKVEKLIKKIIREEQFFSLNFQVKFNFSIKYFLIHLVVVYVNFYKV